jgi:hypothetical protein
MQRFDKHLAISICNNSSYVIVADVITRYWAITSWRRFLGGPRSNCRLILLLQQLRLCFLLGPCGGYIIRLTKSVQFRVQSGQLALRDSRGKFACKVRFEDFLCVVFRLTKSHTSHVIALQHTKSLRIPLGVLCYKSVATKRIVETIKNRLCTLV